MTKSLMLLGTASNVGKSILTTAMCRIFYQDGYRVAPFKAQNMSLNSAVTPSGREIGRAQGAQAEACGLLPNEHMNPVLLKPTGHMASQVIVQGRVLGQRSARAYFEDDKQGLWQAVTESYRYLADRHDIIVLEGAGSPVEMNLKRRDIANLRCAEMADAEVILIADIDRGGVFASLVGTMQLMTDTERARVRGVLINKFRGDPALFDEGRIWLESYLGVPVLGVIPYIPDIGIDEEDSVGLESLRYRPSRGDDNAGNRLRIAIVQFPHLSNFTDFDPLFADPHVDVIFTTSLTELQDADAIVLPGTKATLLDLVWLKETGLAEAISEARRSQTALFAICGGYQMLGREVLDPNKVESDISHAEGLGLFPNSTTMLGEKTTRWVEADLIGPFAGMTVTGYEIHMGETRYAGTVQPLATLRDGSTVIGTDGCVNDDGRVVGTYLHGILHHDAFRSRWLNQLRAYKGWPPVENDFATDRAREEAYDRLAEVVRSHVDIDKIYSFLMEG